MAREDEELLLKDLCERLPYRPKIKIGKYYDYTLMGIDLSKEKPIIVELEGHSFGVSCKNVQLVLRPISSMTEEEYEEYTNIAEFGDYEQVVEDVLDFFHKKHLDFRNLIPKGLALEATEGMYKIK